MSIGTRVRALGGAFTGEPDAVDGGVMFRTPEWLGTDGCEAVGVDTRSDGASSLVSGARSGVAGATLVAEGARC